MATTDPTAIRRSLREGDAAAIAELHRRVYVPEFGLNDNFVASVRRGLQTAIATGWPQAQGAVWLVERDGAVAGSLALTLEAEGRGRVRWFVLESSLRGRGLGQRLLAELLASAREAALNHLALETFAALRTAARIYRTAGFELVSEVERNDWGPPVFYQRYELELS